MEWLHVVQKNNINYKEVVLFAFKKSGYYFGCVAVVPRAKWRLETMTAHGQTKGAVSNNNHTSTDKLDVSVSWFWRAYMVKKIQWLNIWPTGNVLNKSADTFMTRKKSCGSWLTIICINMYI